jgi:hypothetical protein
MTLLVQKDNISSRPVNAEVFTLIFEASLRSAFLHLVDRRIDISNAGRCIGASGRRANCFCRGLVTHSLLGHIRKRVSLPTFIMEVGA